MMDNYLFDSVTEALENYKENRKWIAKFLKLKYIWQNYQYIYSYVGGASQSDPHKALSIFMYHLKNYYKHYCQGETPLYTEDELREVITVMILEGLYLSKDNIEKTYLHIKQGFYREHLHKVEKDIEVEREESETQKLINEIDWGDL